MTTSLRERQAPLKARFEADPESAKPTFTVKSATVGDDPTRVRIQTNSESGPILASWDVGAHPLAAGDGECFGQTHMPDL